MKQSLHKKIRSAFGEDLDAVSILVPDNFMRKNTLLKSCMPLGKGCKNGIFSYTSPLLFNHQSNLMIIYG